MITLEPTERGGEQHRFGQQLLDGHRQRAPVVRQPEDVHLEQILRVEGDGIEEDVVNAGEDGRRDARDGEETQHLEEVVGERWKQQESSTQLTSLYPQSGSIRVAEEESTRRSITSAAQLVSSKQCAHSASTVWYQRDGAIISPGVSEHSSSVPAKGLHSWTR